MAAAVMRVPPVLHRDIAPPHPLERYKHLQDKETRRKTYKKWKKSSKLREELIADGFFYLGEEDTVQCAFCGGVFHGLKDTDNLHIEHYRHFPKCKIFDLRDENDAALFSYVSESRNADQADSVSHTDTELMEGIKKLQIDQNHNYPKHKYYALYKDRLKTFENWPTDKSQKKEDLAAAGLFYAGVNDVCECYCCGGQLDEWEPEDVPVEEHDNFFSDICVLTLSRNLSKKKKKR